VPLYVLNVTYPLVPTRCALLRGKRAVLMIEEGQPDFIEQNIVTILRRPMAWTPRARQGPAADGRRLHRARC
jgi:indolepyruvate ferredoxin oxidoreductase alpha subunit